MAGLQTRHNFALPSKDKFAEKVLIKDNNIPTLTFAISKVSIYIYFSHFGSVGYIYQCEPIKNYQVCPKIICSRLEVWQTASKHYAL